MVLKKSLGGATLTPGPSPTAEGEGSLDSDSCEPCTVPTSARTQQQDRFFFSPQLVLRSRSWLC